MKLTTPAVYGIFLLPLIALFFIFVLNFSMNGNNALFLSLGLVFLSLGVISQIFLKDEKARFNRPFLFGVYSLVIFACLQYLKLGIIVTGVVSAVVIIIISSIFVSR